MIALELHLWIPAGQFQEHGIVSRMDLQAADQVLGLDCLPHRRTVILEHPFDIAGRRVIADADGLVGYTSVADQL